MNLQLSRAKSKQPCAFCKQPIHDKKLIDLDTETYYHAKCMTPRTSLEREYNTDSYGIIRSPGKFEGEPLYVPYFWEVYLNGFADEDDGEVLTFHVNAEDRILFPEIGDTKTVYLFEDSRGFVCEIDKPEIEEEIE